MQHATLLEHNWVTATGSAFTGPLQMVSGMAVPEGAASLMFLAALGTGLIGAILAGRQYDQWGRDRSRSTYRLEFARDLTLDKTTAFMRSLVSLRPRWWQRLGRDSVVLEIIGRAEGIEYRLRLPRPARDRVRAQLRAAVGSAQVTLVERPEPVRAAVVREIWASELAAPLRVDQAEAFTASLLHAFDGLSATAQEVLVYQLVVFPIGQAPVVAARSTTKSSVGPRWLRAVASFVTMPSTTQPDKEAAKHKASEPLFGVAVRVGARSAARGRSGHLVGRVVGTLHQLETAGVRLGRSPRPWDRRRGRIEQGATPITPARVRANAKELAVMVGWPIGNPTVPGLRLRSGRVFAPVRELESVGRVVGQAIAPGHERPIALTPQGALMHLLVSGPTGSGKSTVLLNLITQAMAAGDAVIVVDPGGDLARDVIDRIPQERTSDLVLLDPADVRTVGLNPLDCAPEDVELASDQVLALIRDQAESWGVQIEETLKATLALLAASPGMTMTEIPAVLMDASGLRARLLARLDEAFAPTIAEFFARFEAWPPGQRTQNISAVLNKITPLIGRRSLRAILGQATPAWTMRQVMEERKILVVTLPEGLVGPLAVDLIGALVVTEVWNAALARVTMRREARQPVSLVIDELPRFVRGGMSLADLLARARGHGLSLTGAVQHIAQVRPDLRSALLSEARSKIILQPAADDAAVFARHLPEVRPEDLLTLAPHTAVASLVAGGQVVAPVSVALAPAPPATGFGEAARAASRARYGRDRAEVEREIVARRQPPQAGPRRTRRLP